MSKTNSRSSRPLPTNYNQINDLDISPKRKRRRIKSLKIFWSCFVILLGLLIVVIYLILVNKEKNCEKKTTDLCLNRSCIISAATIWGTLDESVLPCDDFYDFACGKSTINYENHNSYFANNEAKKKLNLELKTLLESLHDKEEPNYIRKLYAFYRSCMNEELIEELNVSPLLSTIDELGGWPVVKGSEWHTKGEHFDWLNTYIMMRKIGVNTDSIIKLSFDTDSLNSSRSAIYLDQPLFSWNRNHFNNSDVYLEFMVGIAVMMNADPNAARMDMLDVLNFQKRLINISLSEEDHSNISFVNNNYYYMTAQQIQTLAPNINWIQFLTEFIGTAVNDDTEVVVLVPSYMKNLSEILINTEPRVLANYLIWNVIFSSLPFLSNKWSQQRERFLSVVHNDYSGENRWQTCIKQAQHYMPYSLGSAYVKTHFNIGDKVEVVAMMDNMRRAFIEMLDMNTWMTDEVRRKAQEKALLMDLRIGFPEELLDDIIMDSTVNNVCDVYPIRIDEINY